MDANGLFKGNIKSRTYVNGHERVDVLEDRRQFLDYFSNSYDSVETNSIYEKNLAKKKCMIFIEHDESIFRLLDIY